jgi:hypothetical protein
MLTIDILYQSAKADFEGYVRTRKEAVQRGAETGELAAVLVQKYGAGMAKVLRLAADLSDFPAPDLTADVDRRVSELDPYWRTTFQLRIDARPAALSLTPAAVASNGTMTKLDESKHLVAAWNASVREGDDVTYEKSPIEGRIVSKVVGPAKLLGDEAVVELKHIGYALLSKTKRFFG